MNLKGSVATIPPVPAQIYLLTAEQIWRTPPGASLIYLKTARSLSETCGQLASTEKPPLTRPASRQYRIVSWS